MSHSVYTCPSHIFSFRHKSIARELSDDVGMAEKLSAHSCRFGLSANGALTGFHTSDNDPLWVANLKRGIVSILQVRKGSK